MVHATHDSLTTMDAARVVILLAPIFEGSEAKDLLFPGPSIFRAKQNRNHRNSMGGK
jgi:hypothetical protein